MSFGITPRASYKPLGRQPFRPGQWQGYKAGSKHTTYIQNNFFGTGYTSGYNYGNYGSYCNHDDGGLSKGMKWLLGIGIGTTLLGGILKLFGIGGKEEAGAIQTPNPNENPDGNNDAVVGGNKPPQAAGEAGEAEEAGEAGAAEDPTQSSKPESNPYDWSKFDSMVCRDASGKTQNISGNINITQKGAEGEAPKEFTITDNSSGTPHTYTYQLAGTTSDGKPLYNCVAMNGQPINGSAQYTLETKADGTPELVQYENQNNFGKGLKFGSISGNSGSAQDPAGASNKTFTKTIEVNTSAGPATITVTANSQEELDKKVAAEEAKSKEYQNATDYINGNETTDNSAIPTSNPWSFLTAKTGKTAQNTQTQTNIPENIQNWNKSHPDQQITVSNNNGKTTYTTTAKIQTKYGVQTHTVNGSSIEDLGKQIAELKKKAQQANANTAGGYAGLGGAMWHPGD